MGRKKIKIERITDERSRSVTYLKRKAGLMKKAHELAVLTQSDVAVIVFAKNGRLAQFSSGDMDQILLRYTEHDGPVEHRGPQDYRYADHDTDHDDAGEEAGHRAQVVPSGRSSLDKRTVAAHALKTGVRPGLGAKQRPAPSASPSAALPANKRSKATSSRGSGATAKAAKPAEAGPSKPLRPSLRVDASGASSASMGAANSTAVDELSPVDKVRAALVQRRLSKSSDTTAQGKALRRGTEGNEVAPSASALSPVVHPNVTSNQEDASRRGISFGPAARAHDAGAAPLLSSLAGASDPHRRYSSVVFDMASGLWRPDSGHQPSAAKAAYSDLAHPRPSTAGTAASSHFGLVAPGLPRPSHTAAYVQDGLAPLPPPYAPPPPPSRVVEVAGEATGVDFVWQQRAGHVADAPPVAAAAAMQHPFAAMQAFEALPPGAAAPAVPSGVNAGVGQSRLAAVEGVAWAHDAAPLAPPPSNDDRLAHSTRSSPCAPSHASSSSDVTHMVATPHAMVGSLSAPAATALGDSRRSGGAATASSLKPRTAGVPVDVDVAMGAAGYGGSLGGNSGGSGGPGGETMAQTMVMEPHARPYVPQPQLPPPAPPRPTPPSGANVVVSGHVATRPTPPNPSSLSSSSTSASSSSSSPTQPHANHARHFAPGVPSGHASTAVHLGGPPPGQAAPGSTGGGGGLASLAVAPSSTAGLVVWHGGDVNVGPGVGGGDHPLVAYAGGSQPILYPA